MTSQPIAGTPVAQDAIWHDLECGSYRADLPLWETLAATQGSPILELGAGTGRVALHLARQGHRVTALERDPRLLQELARRAHGLEVETVAADARAFDLSLRFALCLVPMQMVQLLGGATGRTRMLACAARHLRPGGLLAIALSRGLEPFRAGPGGAAPLPDTCEVQGTLYFSQPTAIYRRREGHVLERRRETVAPAGARTVTRDTITLDHLDLDQLECEGAACGLAPIGRTVIAATPDHAASEVVMLGA